MSQAQSLQKVIGSNRSLRSLATKLNVRHIHAISQFLTGRSALHDMGWFKSSKLNQSVDAHGEPIPWLVYPIISLLATRVGNDLSVFEYGSGNSTLWWAKHVRHVVACENDSEWYRTMKRKLPANAELVLADVESGEYSEQIKKEQRKFDIIVIDGRDRVKCAINAVPKLTKNGVMIWDNTDRERYKQGYDEVCNLGFKVIDFVGLTPIDNVVNQTSLFYRTDNCLNI